MHGLNSDHAEDLKPNRNFIYSYVVGIAFSESLVFTYLVCLWFLVSKKTQHNYVDTHENGKCVKDGKFYAKSYC
jgi:hypothetical protein